MRPEIVRALKAEGLVHPFPIQSAAIPAAIQGGDILGRGPTGSGKTFTFGLPMIHRLASGFSKPKQPRGLILVPTRELATQVRARLEPLAAAAGQRVLEVVGGVKIQRNLTALARPVDILVATPGRLQDLLDQKILALSSVSMVALDEADQMADMGFLPQVTKLLKAVPQGAQHLLFSATLDGDVQQLVDRFLNDPVEFSTGEAKVSVDSMNHTLVISEDPQQRTAVLNELVRAAEKMVMFVRTTHGADRLAKKLQKMGTQAVALHGNKGQSTRTAALGAFSTGEAPVLVATDIAARGIDVKDVDVVVHVDAPADPKAYVHRAGRTARAGAAGAVVTLTYADKEADVWAMMAKAGVDPQVIVAPNFSASDLSPCLSPMTNKTQ